MTIKAFRSGETAPNWSDDPYGETYHTRNGKLSFEFKMPSKGGGVTDVSLRIPPDCFEEIARAMMTADNEAAIHAFGAALAARKVPKSN